MQIQHNGGTQPEDGRTYIVDEISEDEDEESDEDWEDSSVSDSDSSDSEDTDDLGGSVENSDSDVSMQSSISLGNTAVTTDHQPEVVLQHEEKTGKRRTQNAAAC